MALVLLLHMAAQSVGVPPTREQALASAVSAADRGYAAATSEPPPPNLGSRDLFAYALVYCETGANIERCAALFDRAAQMQDVDPASRGYGNFRWYWSQTEVLDFNAVDFSMQTASLLWRHHRDRLPASARARLNGLMTLGIEGCLRHRVSPSYTNIALMNAGNLIFLGELFDRPDAANEGYRRLENAAREIWDNGIHEYNSPTYYGVDLDDLALIEAYAAREQGVTTARALLDLFCRQVALNWFAPNQRLGGPCSRDYDYLRGLGYLHTPLWVWGWPIGREAGGTGVLPALLSRYRPDAETMALTEKPLPRLIRARFGPTARETWTHFVASDASLGSAGSSYHNMDIPLCFQLAGGHQQVRGYFIADGRHDPYGKTKIPEARGGHSKTLHLAPFWTAAQARADVLGYVAYRPSDVPDGTQTLESHIVLPRNLDGLWLDERPVELGQKTFNALVPDGATVVLRKGTGLVGIKVLAARDCGGRPATVTLCDDGNPHGALRLTVTHAARDAVGGKASALFLVRIGTGADATRIEAWRRAFAAARADVKLGEDSVSASATTPAGPVAIDASYRVNRVQLTPAPTQAVTELDGVDIGRQRLARAEPFASWAKENTDLPRIDLAAEGDTAVEAETGRVRPGFAIGDDPLASGGRYVWYPGEPGGKFVGSGSTRWQVRSSRAMRVFLFGRVIAPTPDDDSFFVTLFGPDGEGAEPITWSTGTHARWEWSSAGAIEVPAGNSVLEVRVREDGTKLDRIILSTKADLPR